MAVHYNEGPHWAEVVEQGWRLANNEKQTPYFFLEIIPFERIGINGDNLPVSSGYRRTIKNYLTEKTAERFAADMLAIGFDASLSNPIVALDPSTPNHHSFVGQNIQVSNRYEKDKEGKDYERWSILVDRKAGGDGTPIDQQGLRKLDALYGKFFNKAKQAPASPAPRRQASQPLEPVANGVNPMDDEIPF